METMREFQLFKASRSNSLATIYQIWLKTQYVWFSVRTLFSEYTLCTIWHYAEKNDTPSWMDIYFFFKLDLFLSSKVTIKDTYICSVHHSLIFYVSFGFCPFSMTDM